MAAASTNPPLKSIKETYQMKTHLEHIRLRPDTYVGSVQQHKTPLWVYEDGAMVHRYVTYVPGLYKIFDEILVNAADHKQRNRCMNYLQEGIYVPELIFANLLTSSNYHDNERKTFGSTNGYGAILANIFSREFVIEIADGRRQKKYKQLYLKLKREEIDRFAAIEEKKLEDPCSITRLSTSVHIGSVHDLVFSDQNTDC
uniref:DNA topoisomerase (ATP-hydrolyzing) n=1 Tax=Aegilops tauschii TaxID=37682 RepID=N1QR06_AEGTA